MLNQSSIFVVVVAKTCTFFFKNYPFDETNECQTLRSRNNPGNRVRMEKKARLVCEICELFFFSHRQIIYFFFIKKTLLLKKKKKTRVKRIWEKRKNQEKTWKRASIFFAFGCFSSQRFFPPLYIIFHSDRVRISLRRVDHRHVVSFSLARMRQRRFHPGMNWNYSRG